MLSKHPILRGVIYALVANLILIGPWNLIDGVHGIVARHSRSLHFPLALNGPWTWDFFWYLFPQHQITNALKGVFYAIYAIEWFLITVIASHCATPSLFLSQERKRFLLAFTIAFPLLGIVLVFALSRVPLVPGI